MDIHLVGGLGGRSSVCECTPRWMRCASSVCLRWTRWMGAVLHLEHCSVHLDPPVDVYLVRSVDSVELGGFGTRWTRWTRWIGVDQVGIHQVDQVDPPGGPRWIHQGRIHLAGGLGRSVDAVVAVPVPV